MAVKLSRKYQMQSPVIYLFFLFLVVVMSGCSGIPYELRFVDNPSLAGVNVDSKDPLYLTKFGLYENAEERYKEIIEKDPENIENILRLASLYKNTGRLEESLELFRQIEAIDKENVFYLNNYSWYLISTGDRDDIAKGVALSEKALAIIEDTMKNIPYGAEVPLLDNLMWGYYKLNDRENILNYFNRISRYRPIIEKSPLLFGHYKTVQGNLVSAK